jgi:uncharacterized protein HemX
MPDSKTEPKAGQPAFDPISALGKLKEIVGNNKDPKTGGGKSWIGTLILIAVALVGTAIWAWISWRRNQELAKLRHEKFVTEIKAEQAVVDAKLKTDSEKIEKSKAAVAVAAEKVRELESDIRAEEARYAADLRAIDSIRSWRDVDPSVR